MAQRRALLVLLLLLLLLVAAASAKTALYVGGAQGLYGADDVLAVWDGAAAWSTLPGLLPTGPSGLCTLAVLDGALVAGGVVAPEASSGGGEGGIARWDGAQWAALGGGRPDAVWRTVNFNGSLYASVGELGVRGVLDGWDGSQWTRIADGAPQAMLPYNGSLILGGAFTSFGGVAADNIVAWDDGTQFTPLGAGVDLAVWALTEYRGVLIAAGRFIRAGGITVNRIASWDGQNWGALGSGIGGSGSVNALAVYKDAVFAGGFFEWAGGEPAKNVAQWDGSQWLPLAGGVGANVEAFAVFNGALVVGGNFDDAGGVQARKVALWDGVAWSSPAGRLLKEYVSTLLVHCAANFAAAGSGDEDCTACVPEHFGPDCLDCAECAAHGVCEPGAAGRCVCDAGWDGAACTTCAPTHFGPSCLACDACAVPGTGNTCFGGGSTDGNCTCGAGRDGELCDACVSGHYGSACTPCTLCEMHGECTEGIEGFCTCDSGWAGGDCAQCAADHYGAECAPCAECNGECASGLEGACSCRGNWAGPPTCAVCAPGFYGTDCALSCAVCSEHGECVGSDGGGQDGACTCDDGWAGAECSECADGRFGDACTPCDLCVANNGTCVPGRSGTCACSLNRTGTVCDACELGKFGPMCEYKCNVCNLHGDCTEGPAGGCACEYNWDGPECAECRDGYYGQTCRPCPPDRCVCVPNGCANGGVCDFDLESGASRCLCVPGYDGPLCETATACRQENQTCLNGGVCNPSSVQLTLSMADDVDNVEEVRCYCPRDFDGDRCEIYLSTVQIDLIAVIMTPLAVVAAAASLYAAAAWHARRHGNARAHNLAIIAFVLGPFDFFSNLLFLLALWQTEAAAGASSASSPSLLTLLATVFMVAPLFANIVLSTYFILKQTKRAHDVGGRDAAAWFQQPRHNTIVVIVWLLAFMDVEVLGVLNSCMFGASTFDAPWADHTDADHWITIASLVAVVGEDLPQLLIQTYVALNESASTVVIIAATASGLTIIHAVLDRIYAVWLRRLASRSPAVKASNKTAPYTELAGETEEPTEERAPTEEAPTERAPTEEAPSQTKEAPSQTKEAPSQTKEAPSQTKEARADSTL